MPDPVTDVSALIDDAEYRAQRRAEELAREQVICARCGFPRRVHPRLGEPWSRVRVCPTSLFRPPAE